MFVLSFRLKPIPRTQGIRIDFVGVVLSALAIACILFGFNNLNTWGLVAAKDAAPISLFGLSPAPFLIALGIVFGQAFFVWSERRVADKKTPLLALEVINSTEQRAAVGAFLVAGGIGSVVAFIIPLYIQIVQDQTPLFTSVAIVPYALAVAAAAILSVRLYDRLDPAPPGCDLFQSGGGRLGAVGLYGQQRMGDAGRDPWADHRRPGRGHHVDAAVQRAGLVLA